MSYFYRCNKQWEKINKILNTPNSAIRKGRLYYHYYFNEGIYHNDTNITWFSDESRIYSILDLAVQEETEDIVVIYKEEFGHNVIKTMNINKWEEEVINKDGKKTKRFIPVSSCIIE